jgi:pyoverdine/dityrosine biosynthesis protein Dit1
MPRPQTPYAGTAGLSTAAATAPRTVWSTCDASELASNILKIVMEHQRLIADQSCPARPCDRCLAVHRDRVIRFVALDMPVEFVLPAFPAKSPNNWKVLGAAPDMAEQLSLEFLRDLCDRVRQIYPHGARIIICADGRVFSDLVGIGESNVTRYQTELRTMVNTIGRDSLELFNLDDEYIGFAYAAMRQMLMKHYGDDLEVLKQQVRAGGDQLALYRAITRFLVEDAQTPDYQGTRAALQRKCRERAYGVVQRSKAWGKLVAERFPDAVRLSIHPQPCGSDKLGVQLVEASENWLTPWHSTAVDVGGRFILMKRRQAEALGAKLVFVDGKPSHYMSHPPNTCLVRRSRRGLSHGKLQTVTK